MNQYPILDNPPSYEHAVRDQPATIGETTVVTKSFSSVQPSAPPQIPQNYGSISEIIQSQPAVNTIIVLPSNACPICRIGLLDDDYSCLGICLAIFCFPIGILCCLACKNKRCSNCGAII